MTEIVVGVDGSDTSVRALQWAVTEARLRTAEVRVVTAWSFPALAALPVPGPNWSDLQQMAESTARGVVAQVGAAGLQVTTQIAQGRAAEALAAASAAADLLVVGSRGQGGFRGLLLGSVSREILHRATVPTVVVPPTYTATGPVEPTVVVGVDGSEEGRRAATLALEEARLRGGRLRVIHTFDLGMATATPEMAPALAGFRAAGRALLDDEAARVEGQGVPVKTSLSFASPAGALISAARRADLLVVGTHGRGPLAGVLLGSVSAACAGHARCPVMVVPAERSG